ncbi:unnamed protein product, partial [Oikopleura dioica]
RPAPRVIYTEPADGEEESFEPVRHSVAKIDSPIYN